MITGAYGGDTTHASSSASFTVNVRSRPGGSVLLTFNGFELDDFNNGVGQLDVLVNGQLVVDLPAGLNSLTGTGDYKPYENVAVDFGPFDITNFVVNGQNTILFRDPTSFDHFGVVRSVSIIQGSTILLQVPRARGVYPGFSFSYTFSNPPLTLTGITASSLSPVVEQAVTFTVNYTGGTGPVTCVFLFGDGGSAIVQGTNGTCTAIHHYFGSGSFIMSVSIIGSSTSDRVRSNLSVTVANDSTEI
jgi:hypothetical protein